ncbi:MAG TPA: ABC transporter ATP-binding protein [Candidatus Dormibacteraeota bacterium]|nr:ABC transporter ATP-binding protein [Candidatus Dormibacteraeota bacterium]
MTPVVEARDLVVRYDDFVALDRLTFDVSTGEALGIVGPNGSGKSTLLKSIAGLVPVAGGTLRVLGSDPRRVRVGSIAYVPQVETVDWSFPANVWDVVSMGRFPRLRFWNRFGADDRAAVEQALQAVGMRELAHRHIAELSGGQQQRVFVARALAQEPRLLLLDEPTTGVDAATEETLREVVRALVRGGLPVLMSTHDLESVERWFDRLMVLDRRVLALGKPHDVVEGGAYVSIREHVHTHGHLRLDHEVHETHAFHPEIRP